MINNGPPTVSVVMGVYNGGRFLREAVKSVLGQSFRDFEFLIVDDGSTDDTAGMLREFSDPRIRVITNERNEGLTRCLIKGCREARGKYIARMDADDISYPNRFQKQVDFLDTHERYAVVGTQYHILDDKGKTRATSSYFCSTEEIQEDIWRRSPFAHGSTMFVKEKIAGCGGYRNLFRYTQDYDLWLRVVERHKTANLPSVLYGLRYHRASITLQRLYFQLRFADLAREFARIRAGTGSDPIMRGDIEQIQAKIESWRPNGLLQNMKIRSDSASQLLSFMAPWGRPSDVFALWLTALCNNPLNGDAWSFLISSPLKSRLRRIIRNRMRLET